jgi:putative peptidoglycan lipid II flippase
VNLFKAASTVSLFTLASRITGLGRELCMAHYLGVGVVTDAFNVAFRIPNLLRRLFAEGAFTQAFVPVLAQTRAQEGNQATLELAARVALLLCSVLLGISFLGILGAPLWVWAMASGLQKTPHTFELTILLTRCLFPYIFFISLVALLSGVLNVWQRFAIPAVTPVLLNLSMMAGTVYGVPYLAQHGLEPALGLAGGVLLGGLLQLGLQIGMLHRLGLWLPQGWRAILTGRLLRAAWQDPRPRRIARLMTPALLGVGVAQISLLINTQIASYLGPGCVSWLSYADRLMEFPTALLGVALGVVLMPQLARAKAHGDSTRYRQLLDWGLKWVAILGLPCALALGLLAQALVSTLYYHGAFSSHDVHETALAVSAYGMGLLGLVGIKVLAPGYYANQDLKTPVRIAVFILVLTQVLNGLFVPWFNQAGLALSIGLGAVMNAGLLLRGLIVRGHYRFEKDWLVFMRQIAGGNLVLFFAWMYIQGQIDWLHLSSSWRLGALTLVTLASLGLYGGTLFILGFRWRPFLNLMRE